MSSGLLPFLFTPFLELKILFLSFAISLWLKAYSYQL